MTIIMKAPVHHWTVAVSGSRRFLSSSSCRGSSLSLSRLTCLTIVLSLHLDFFVVRQTPFKSHCSLFYPLCLPLCTSHGAYTPQSEIAGEQFGCGVKYPRSGAETMRPKIMLDSITVGATDIFTFNVNAQIDAMHSYLQSSWVDVRRGLGVSLFLNEPFCGPCAKALPEKRKC